MYEDFIQFGFRPYFRYVSITVSVIEMHWKSRVVV